MVLDWLVRRVERIVEPHTTVEMVEEVDLLTTAQTITLTKPWHQVERMVLSLEFTGNAVDLDLFGIDAALSPGIIMRYKGNEIYNVATNHELTKFSYDVSPLQDDQAGAARVNVWVSRYSFNRFGDGLELLNHNNWLEIIIPDLSSSSNDNLTMVFEGWGL